MKDYQSGVTPKEKGLDPFAARKLNSLIDNTFSPEDLLRFISEPGLVFVSSAAANLARADGRLWLYSGGRLGKSRPLHILSSIEIAKNPQKAVVFGDISWVQEMLQGPGKLKKIDLLIENPQLVARIEELLPPHVKIAAVAALMVALSMSMAISLMIGSFRKTVDQWFTNSIQGDFYVTGSALMLYRMRLKAGGQDASSSGTWR